MRTFSSDLDNTEKRRWGKAWRRERERAEGKKSNRETEGNVESERDGDTRIQAHKETPCDNCFPEPEPCFLVPQLCRPGKTKLQQKISLLLTVNTPLFILSFLTFHNLNFIPTNERADPEMGSTEVIGLRRDVGHRELQQLTKITQQANGQAGTKTPDSHTRYLQKQQPPSAGSL